MEMFKKPVIPLLHIFMLNSVDFYVLMEISKSLHPSTYYFFFKIRSYQETIHFYTIYVCIHFPFSWCSVFQLRVLEIVRFLYALLL